MGRLMCACAWLLILTGCVFAGYEPGVEEECVIAEDDAGDGLFCTNENSIIYVCALSDESECWYETNDVRFYAEGDCTDARVWEDPAWELAEYCEL